MTPPLQKSPLSCRSLRWGVAAVLLLVTGVILLESMVQVSALPESIHAPLQGSPVVYDREGGVLAMLPGGPARTHFVGRLADMGRWLPEVTVNLEDHRFHEHTGIDPYAIAAAAWSDLKAWRLHRGGSTITQQLIKQELGKRGRQWRRKWREALLALKLERSWSKEAVLEGYLNRLDYGNRRFGAESASLAYFGKRCQALTLAEAIYLAGLPQAPTRYNPWRNPESAARKYARSIARLTTVGYLSERQAEALLAAPPQPGNFTSVERAPHFLDAVMRQREDPISGALVTSLDPEIQEQAESLLKTHLEAIGRDDVRNGAIVVLENATGKVRALSSSAVENGGTEAINAALTPRHAGSTIKPFVYQQALEERRYTPASVLTDTEEAVGPIYSDYDPKNYSKRYYGPVRLREALGNSLNIPAILVSHDVGPRRAFERLAEWGLQERDAFSDDGAGFVLGNRRVTLLDLCFAYSTLARGGLTAPGPLFTEDATPAWRRMANREACLLIEDILADNDARSHAFGTRSLLRFPPGQRTAVKTGTSSNFRDAWVVGYNASHTVGVWMGNLDGQGMDGALSVHTAGPVWRRMMDYLARHRHARGLPSLQESERIIALEIDALTGLLPVPETRRTLTEWFLRGTEPVTEGKDWYVGDRIVLPEAYRAWTRSPHNHLGALASESSKPWEITRPEEGARYVIDPALPRAQQVLPFATDHPSPGELQWYLNDRPLDETVPLRWVLQPGRWVLRAYEPETGREVSHAFVVER